MVKLRSDFFKQIWIDTVEENQEEEATTICKHWLLLNASVDIAIAAVL